MGRHVALWGFMGAGKSTVGGLLAARLGRPFVDLDRRVEAQEGATVPELFRARGEAGFRAAEALALVRVLDEPPAVIALGGGTLCDPDLRARTRQRALLVTLHVPLDEALRRLGNDPGRPLLSAGKERVAALYEARRAAYEDAHRVVPTAGRRPEEVVEELAAWLAAGEA